MRRTIRKCFFDVLDKYLKNVKTILSSTGKAYLIRKNLIQTLKYP